MGDGKREKISDLEVNKKEPYGVMPEAFQKLIAAPGTALLDTRDSQVFTKGFVPGSINIGAQGNLKSLAATLLPRDANKLLLVTEPGHENETILALGELAAYRDVCYLFGGFETWARDGKPVDSIERVSAENLVRMLADHPLSFIDVRKPSEYYYEHVKGAVNIPLERINKITLKLYGNEPHFVYCAGGYRSVIFNSILRKQGLTSLVDVTGGYAAIRNTYRAPLVFASG